MKAMLTALLFIGAAANADVHLANNGKTVICTADDNQSWVLNKSRTTVKFTVEGESLGARKIIDIKTDGSTFVSYVTDEGTLTLGPKDTYQLSGEEEAWGIDCK